MTKDFCGTCEHVSPTEKEQDEIYVIKHVRVDHRCKLLDVQLFHLGDHPNLHKEFGCPFKGEEV